MVSSKAIFHDDSKTKKLLNIDNLTGTVEPGKYADFLILDENPAEDLKALRNINTVVFNGRVFKNPTIKRDYMNETLWKLYEDTMI